MADILIRGMEMPSDGCVTLSIHSDKTAYVYGVYPTKILKVIELPPNGDFYAAESNIVPSNKEESE